MADPLTATPDAQPVPPGTLRVIDGRERIFFEGYWIKTYPVPEDTLQAKKRLIEALTRRLFNHTEHGLNIPGHRLSEARQAYEQEADPARKRVKGAMYAGALFNRAADIFTSMVDLQSVGVEISMKNDLMRECGRCLQEALALARLVQHRSGEEGIDELWGEPFRAFCIPLDAFYRSRYLKIAQAMGDLDRIAQALTAALPGPMFAGVAPVIAALARAAKEKVETLGTDAEIFDLWADLVASGEQVTAFEPVVAAPGDEAEQRRASFGVQLLRNGRDLIFYIARARVSMPKSTAEFVERCATFKETGVVRTLPTPLPA